MYFMYQSYTLAPGLNFLGVEKSFTASGPNLAQLEHINHIYKLIYVLYQHQLKTLNLLELFSMGDNIWHNLHTEII